jgi:hypothetical protein
MNDEHPQQSGAAEDVEGLDPPGRVDRERRRPLVGTHRVAVPELDGMHDRHTTITTFTKTTTKSAWNTVVVIAIFVVVVLGVTL